MARYLITTESAGVVLATVARKQKPAAFQAFQAAAYDAIRSIGGLDTHWGRRLLAQTEGAAEDVSRFIVMIGQTRVKFERLS